jgi:hypothetical protein
MSVKYFECKVKYRKTDDSGAQKVVTEAYLVDALSFTEAESRIIEKMTEYLGESFRVTNIRLTNYAEVHACEDSDNWFKSKISIIAYDEESGKERKTNMYLLVQADDVKDAHAKTLTAMKNTMGDFTIPSISETTIVDVFPYFSGEIN